MLVMTNVRRWIITLTLLALCLIVANSSYAEVVKMVIIVGILVITNIYHRTFHIGDEGQMVFWDNQYIEAPIGILIWPWNTGRVQVESQIMTLSTRDGRGIYGIEVHFRPKSGQQWMDINHYAVKCWQACMSARDSSHMSRPCSTEEARRACPGIEATVYKFEKYMMA